MRISSLAGLLLAGILGISFCASPILACGAPPPPDITIDIKYGSCPNAVNLGQQGLLPVTVFGTATIDVTSLSNIKLEGVDLVIKKNGQLMIGYEDVDGDGYMDLTAKFDVQDLVDAGVLGPSTTSLTLTAYYNGTLVSASDSVWIVPP